MTRAATIHPRLTGGHACRGSRPTGSCDAVPLAQRTEISASDVDGARLFVSDMTTAFLLVNDARHRAIERLLGVPRDQANVATLIAALIVAQAAQDHARRVFRAPATPAAGDMLLGTATARELLRGMAGPTSRETPLLGTLLALAVLGGPAFRAARGSLHGIRTSSRRANAGFRHRYGYLVDPGHLRERRARRRRARAPSAA
jgi:hypothetical protein